MAGDVVGREAELAEIHAFLDRPMAGPRTLVLEGEPGIGKSALWQAAVAAAGERGLRVLASHPAESERTFSNVVLGDLLRELPPDALAALPAPRRRALEAALLIGEDEGPVDPRGLGAALVSVLGGMAATSPVVVAIDDLQWADRSSLAALRFAVRRLPDAPLLAVLTRRVEAGGAGEEPLPETANEHQRLELGPLSVGALQLLLRRAVGQALPRPAARRLFEASGGNPLHALELARAGWTGASEPDAPQLPRSLEHVVRERLDRLGQDPGPALLLIATLGRAAGFIFSSTMLVHAPAGPGEEISAEDKLGPTWAYPRSKLLTERVIRETRGQIPAVLLRISGVYDEGCNSIPLAHQIQRIAERQLTSRLYPGDPERGQAFMHLDDLTDAIERVVDRRAELPPELAVVLGEPEVMSYAELQDALGRLIHGDERWVTVEIPKIIAKAGAWMQDVAPVEDPFIKPWMVDRTDDHYDLDIQRAQRLLGWIPRHTLRETLPAMVAQLKRDPDTFYAQNGLGDVPFDVREVARAR